MRRQAALKEAEIPDPCVVQGWPGLWLMSWDVKAHARFTRLLIRNPGLGLKNAAEINDKLAGMRQSPGACVAARITPSCDFPRPRVALTDTNFAPDYFSNEGHDFCSRRLREALAQPDDVVQFLPVDLVAGSKAACAQDYTMMHILARQPVMDVARSDCRVEEVTHHVTGKTVRIVAWINRIVLLDKLTPRTEIFHPDEVGSRIMVADALAARVLEASCTGMEFRDPAVPWHGMRVERLRTTTGIAERRVGFLD